MSPESPSSPTSPSSPMLQPSSPPNQLIRLSSRLECQPGISLTYPVLQTSGKKNTGDYSKGNDQHSLNSLLPLYTCVRFFMPNSLCLCLSPFLSLAKTCHRLLHAGISEAPLTVMPLSRLTPGQGQQSSVTARESFSAPSEKQGNTLLLERAYVTPPLTSSTGVVTLLFDPRNPADVPLPYPVVF